MSLRAFHILFIAISVVLLAFVTAWAGSQYRVQHQALYALAGVGSLLAGAGLAVYGATFVKKTRNL